MTRGSLYLICNELIIESIEFNGDMYPDGHGQDVIKAFEDIETANDFRIAVEKFNKEKHGYTDISSLTRPIKRCDYMTGDKVVMTEENYFDKFFSDWTFWKNISDKTVKIKTKDSSKLITLLPNEQVAIRFGSYEGHYKTSVECAEIIKKEEEEYKAEQEKRASTIEKKSLYFKSGSSDKEYHVQVEKKGEGFVVNFQYGRRGSALRKGEKTALPTTLAIALNIFHEVLREKQKKGYR